MAGETIITVIGNMTADPELRYTQAGLAVVNFTIASTPRTFDRQKNEFVDGEPLFLRATAWRDFAEHIASSFTKGSRVIATGALKQKSYETKEGEKRTSMELEVEDIGASVKFAIATVQRRESSRTQEKHRSQVAAGQRQQPNRPEGQEVWHEPAAPQSTWQDDETPF